MKRCVKCTLTVDDDVQTCPRCRSEEFRLIGPGGGGGDDLGPAVEPDAGDIVAPQEIAPAPLEPERRPRFVPPEGPADGVAGPDPVEARPAAEVEKRPVKVVDHAEVIEDEARLRELKQEGLFVIGLLGFPTGGKTWFLNRLKHSYHQPPQGSPQSRRPACVPSPSAAPDNSRVGRTNDILLHHFAVPTDDSLSFHLLDVPGERFQNAAAKNFVGVADMTLATLGACDAIIIVLPADEVLFSSDIADRDRCSIDRAHRSGGIDPAAGRLGLPPADDQSPTDIETLLMQARAQYRRLKKGAPKDRLKAEIERLEGDLGDRREWRLAEAANNVEDFANNVGLFAAVLHLRESGMTAQELGALPTAAAIMLEARKIGYRKRAQPVFIALSKMDAVISPESWLARKLDRIEVGEAQRELLDVDPPMLLARRCAGISHHAPEAFEWCKVDAVTAFGGHTGGDNIHYGCEAYGVSSIIEWIHWARSVAKGGPWVRWEAHAARLLRRIRNYAH